MYLLKFNWFEQKEYFIFYSKLNFRPKNGLLEIAACNLEGPLIVLSSASRATYAIEIEGLWLNQHYGISPRS